MKRYLAPAVAVLVLILVSWYSSERDQAPQTAIKTPLTGTGTSMDEVPPQSVELKDGDTYELSVAPIRKKIGQDIVPMLAYNGSVPGPVLRVKQGSNLTVTLVNRMDIATTLHPHGVRVDNAFDGVPDVTQKVVAPGESFAYRLHFSDPGVYWYHPHFRQDYTQDSGLYGAFVVEPNDRAYWSSVNREEVLMVDDALIDQGDPAPYSAKKVDHVLMGRFGNTMLVNGKTDYVLRTKKGEVVRLYVVNAANTRTFDLSIPGARIKLVGADNGKYERETFVDSVLLSPSERAIVEVLFDRPGRYPIAHRTPDRTYAMGTIEVSDQDAQPSFRADFATLRTNADTIATIDPFRAAFTRNPDKHVTLSMAMKERGHGMMRMGDHAMEGEMGMMESGRNIEWEDTMPMMNAGSTADSILWKMIDRETGRENMEISWAFKKGDTAKIRIFNDPKSPHPMQHPIHFHGQRFLVLATNDQRNENLAWKDTALVQTGDTVDILVDMSNPGTWMAHCHISEHPEAGMMMAFTVR